MTWRTMLRPLDSGGHVLAADNDTDAGNAVPFNPQTGENLFYDNELLDAHYVAGDGRINENVGLTAIQDLFHAEHQRCSPISRRQSRMR